MTEQETRKVLASIYVLFKREKSVLNSEEKNMEVRLWTKAFANVPYSKVSSAVETYIYTDRSGFAPTIGAINGILNEADKASEIDEETAWLMVRKAVRNSLHHADREWEKLPSSVQNAVGGIGQLKEWAWYTDDQMEKAGRSFKKAYSNQISRAVAEKNMPNNLKSFSGELADRLKLE